MTGDAGPPLPNPHEGIYGIDRGDTDLLSLDDRARPHRDGLYVLGRLLRQVTSIGSQPPVVAALWHRMHNPQPGDLVIETSRPHPSPADRVRGFGYLLARRWELRGGVGAEPVWYIQYGPEPDQVARWSVGAVFTTLPIQVTSRWLETEADRLRDRQ